LVGKPIREASSAAAAITSARCHHEPTFTSLGNYHNVSLGNIGAFLILPGQIPDSHDLHSPGNRATSESFYIRVRKPIGENLIVRCLIPELNSESILRSAKSEFMPWKAAYLLRG